MVLRKWCEGVGVGVLVLCLGVLGFVYRGVPAAEVDLNDGGVWVTNPGLGLVGHLNYQSRTLDGGLDPQSRGFDVSQEGNSVVVDGGGFVAGVETATVTLGSKVGVVGFEVVHGGDVVLVADPAGGKVWGVTVAGLAGFSSSMVPLVEGLSGPRVVVGRDGLGFVVTADGVVRRVTYRGGGFEVGVERGSFSGGVGVGAQLTVVGDQLVVLDGGRVRTVSRDVDLGVGDGGVLQEPGLTAGSVAVAVGDGLLRVPLDGSRVSRVGVAAGVAAVPVEVGGCVYGAWSGSGAYVRDCVGDGQDVSAVYPALASARDVVFRVSRDVVVINDAAGNVYLPNEGMAVVSNWDLIRSLLEEQDKQEDETSDETVREESVVEDMEQQPPVAVDDEFGARLAATTTLPVLLNDVDPDGDVLTVKLVDVPEGVDVSLGRQGRSAQVSLSESVSGPVSFTYQAFDGKDVSNTARVTVTPRGESFNSAPYRERDNLIAMSEQATVSYSVLSDWVDPEGDPIYLVNAVGDEGMAVTFRQDGFLSLRDLGTVGAGRRSVEVTVSDGREETTASLRVQVAPGATNLPPIANADHYVVNVGQDVVLRPLSNDSDPNGESLMLAEVGQPAADEKAEVDYEQGTILFSSTRVGSRELSYVVSDGPNSTKGKIRVDVNDPVVADPRPAAQNDLALLPENASVLVPVLDNDTDPAGGVLAVQSVSVDQGVGLTVEVIDHSVLRVSAPAMLKEPKSFSYTVSNGKQSASARVLVLPQPARGTSQPPVALDDSAVVRANDIVAVPVLGNDFSPTDLELSVDPEVEVRGDALGEVFVSGGLVRFKAGDKAGSTTLVYTVRDSAGNRASAKVQVSVRSFDAGNQRPNPRPVTARVFAGATIRVSVPLDGVDPDGDSVELVEGASRGPRLGSVQVRGGYLEYSAQPSASGTDSFTYRVKDRFGQTGEASIEVGVIASPESNQPPVAVPDQMVVRPGQKVEVPVTANDVDPDGDQVSLVDDSAVALAPWSAQLKVVGSKVQLVSPGQEGSYQFSYQITDGRGAPVMGFATVIVDEDALLLPPVAVDDRVSASEAYGVQEVEVAVLDNDHDPDGSDEDLRLEVSAPAVVRDGKVVVPLQSDAQVVLYTVTDSDGLTARAAIFVPGADQMPPMLNPEKVPAKVKGGQTLRIDFAEYVLTRAGHSAKLTSVDSVVAQTGGQQDHPTQGLVVVDETTIEFTADKLFYGPTTVTFEVHDGDSVDDPRGLRSTLSLPVEVVSSGMFPPVLRPSPIQVAQGEPPVRVDLSAMVDDPDEGDNQRMQFTLLSGPGDVKATVVGQAVEVSAGANTPPSTGSFVFRVHDGSTDPVEMTVPVTVVKSNRPLMTTTQLHEPEGRVGQAKVFNLASVITNPFADQNGEITIVNTAVRTGSATVSVSGLNLSVTPSAVGEVVVSYTAQDATGEVGRQVTGQVVLTVKDTPLAPSNLTAKSDVSRTVELSWTQGDLRGGSLKNFVVKWNGGQQDCGAVTNCRITGLANNVDYSFTVSQVTEVGQSPESNVASARPDVKPNQPAVPTTKFGDRRIEVSWPVTQVPDGGSAVTKYNVQVSPGINGQTSFVTSSTTFTATGLTNGTGYRFRIQALNRYAEGNVAREAEYLWSDWSPAEIPAGAPSNQPAPTVVKDKAAAGVAPRATVSWGVPGNSNGDSSFVYELREKGKTNLVYSGSAASSSVTLDVSTQDRTFEVRVTNKSGLWSDWSAASNAVRAFQPPGTPSGFSLTATGKPNTVRFAFGAAAGNGARPNEISYRWSAGGASGTVTSGQEVTSSAFVNGSNVTVTLTAIATVNGETATGGSTTAVVNAYGPPTAPKISASGAYRRVNFSWNADTNSGGRPSTVKLSNGATGANGTTGVDTDFGTNVCLTATITNSEGQSTSSQTCATSWQAPAWESLQGGPAPCSPGLNAPNGCTYYDYKLMRFRPNSTVACTDQGTRTDTPSTMYVRVDGNGYWYGPFNSGSGPWVVANGFRFEKGLCVQQ